MSGWIPVSVAELLAAKGDIAVHNGEAVVALPVGSSSQVLTVDSAEAEGIKWADPTGGSGGGAYAETIGDGSEDTYIITHGLGTADIVVQLWDLTGSDPLEATGDADSIEATDPDEVTVTFPSSIGVDAYRVVILTSGGTSSGGGGGSLKPFDEPPANPDTMDDEFAGGPGMAGKWTTFGGAAITTSDVNSTIADHLYVSTNTNAQISGWYQTLPGTTGQYRLKITDSSFRANFSRGGGLVLLPAGAISGSSPVVYHGLIFDGGWKVNAVRHSALATFAAQIANVAPGKPGEIWIDVEFHSATSVTFRFSMGGGVLTFLSGPYTVPFTVDKIGIGVSGEGVAHEALFDWFRRIS